MKINCTVRRSKRSIVDVKCQAAIASQVCSVARKYNLKCHALGAVLEPGHIARLASLGVTSFDASNWSRPNRSVVEKYVELKRVYPTLKEALFAMVVRRIAERAVLEGVETLLAAKPG